MTTPPLLIVGTFRSGTTYLNHLVGQLPSVISFQQPLPLLFVEVKRAYLQHYGLLNDLTQYYPLNDQQFSNYYHPDEFCEWLQEYIIPSELIKSAFQKMSRYSGQIFRPENPLRDINLNRNVSLVEFVGAYLGNYSNASSDIVAFKETTGCEEYIPYWLRSGGKVIQIIRHPVEVARSLNFGSHLEHTGARRPLLWVARNWRKSALYALAHMGHPDFLLIHFHDLKHRPAEVGSRIGAFLRGRGEHAAPLRSGKLTGWQANSSFSEQSSANDMQIPAKDAELLEAWCVLEMKALGLSAGHVNTTILSRYHEIVDNDNVLDRPELHMYQYSEEQMIQETTRVTSTNYDPPKFLFLESFRRVSATVDGRK